VKLDWGGGGNLVKRGEGAVYHRGYSVIGADRLVENRANKDAFGVNGGELQPEDTWRPKGRKERGGGDAEERTGKSFGLQIRRPMGSLGGSYTEA